MRSGYESFLRRQLSKPRTPALRWADSQPAPAVRSRPGRSEAGGAAPVSPAAARGPLDAMEETMPAVLWRSASPMPTLGDGGMDETPDTGPLVDRISLADDPAPEASATPPLTADEVIDATDSRIDAAADSQPAPLPPTPEAPSTPAAPTAPAAASQMPLPAASPHAALDQLLAAALAEARSACGLGAAIRIGMARLDDIADAFGEQAVGHVLRALRHRLRRLLAHVAPRAQVCGVGEALWVVLPGLGRTSLAEALVRQLLEALTRPLNLRSHAVALHGSAGLAVFPHDGMDASTVRRAAEVAWRQARSRGRSAYQFYAREIESRARRRLAHEALLRHAITHDELTLHYQPRAELRSGALCGAQVLPGWMAPGDVVWSSTELLLLAQESGLGEALAHWSVRAACREAAGWLTAGLPVPRLAVPVLPSAFRRTGFATTAAAQARAQGVAPDRLLLLLSPVAPLAGAGDGVDLARHAPQLRSCREAGFHLGMDGAATTGCSLSALKALPLSELHLDMGLLHDEGDDPGALGPAVVGLGHGLGLRVVAGGVSDEAQLDRLARMGCDEFHGDLLAEPLPSSTWVEVLAGAHGHGSA